MEDVGLEAAMRLVSQPVVLVERDMLVPEVEEFEAGTVATYSARCPGRDGPNEDAAAVVPLPDGGLVLAVADGCGGHRAGETASRIAVDALLDVGEPRDAGLRTAILDAIETANSRIVDARSGAATTLAVAGVEAGRVRAFHAGDSGILLTGQRGRRKLETLAHAPVAHAVEAGVLDEAEALHHEDRSIVSNVVGTHDMRIEMGPSVALARRDTLLLATDGLLDNLAPEEIIDLVRRGSLTEAAEALATTARSRMTEPTDGAPSHPDDLTFLLFRPSGGR